MVYWPEYFIMSSIDDTIIKREISFVIRLRKYILIMLTSYIYRFIVSMSQFSIWKSKIITRFTSMLFYDAFTSVYLIFKDFRVIRINHIMIHCMCTYQKTSIRQIFYLLPGIGLLPGVKTIFLLKLSIYSSSPST